MLFTREDMREYVEAELQRYRERTAKEMRAQADQYGEEAVHSPEPLEVERLTGAMDALLIAAERICPRVTA